MPQTKAKYFVLVYLTKSFMSTPTPHLVTHKRNYTEDLDQRGYTHYAASYTTSLMHYLHEK